MAPSNNKSLKDIASSKNPSQLGDPISLRAETSETKPTPDDTGASHNDNTQDGKGEKTLKERAEQKLNSGNPSQLGDPVSLKAETSDNEPTKDDRGALRDGEKKGKPKL